jgi:mono/diheme cytochrome c family protein
MLRRVIFAVAVLAALVLSFMPVITGERNVGVHDHHLDHAVLMLFGAIAGLALYRDRGDRESPAWLWVAVLAPLAAMLLMAPPLYAFVDAMPVLHAFHHLAFVGLAMLAAYGGQSYVRGVGWATSIMLETMAVVAAFGYGVAPAAATLAPPSLAGSVVPAADIARGKQLFAQNCAVCHGAKGQGGEGPRLIGEASRKDFAQLQAWIKKPLPPMPTLYPAPLSAKDVAAVAAYVARLR